MFQARALGADDKTRVLLLLAPMTKVRGEILEFASVVPQYAACDPQSTVSESHVYKFHEFSTCQRHER